MNQDTQNTQVPVSQILTEAKELISDPKHWSKQAYARDSKGDTCLIFGYTKETFPKDAVCFCGLGAVITAAVKHDVEEQDRKDDKEPSSYLHRAISPHPEWKLSRYYGSGEHYRDFATFNDRETTSHAEVMSAFDRAIALAKSEGN